MTRHEHPTADRASTERTTPERAATDPAALDRIAARLRDARPHARWIAPGDADYDEARALWNGMIQRRPGLIVRCTEPDDVTATLRAVAAEADPPSVAVRGGGHHVAGAASCDGGVVIDLTEMHAVRVDPDRKIAVVEGGATWGDVDAATQAYGLATPGGVVSDTGVAGLTLGGGHGWLRRAYGLACDRLIGATVVTADGTTVHAGAAGESDDADPDLLWGLRGGGGGLGVVTSFTFALERVGPEVAFAFTLYPLDQVRAVAEGHERTLAAAPEISSLLTMGFVPELPEVPAASHGAPFVGVLAVHPGPTDEGERAMRPLRELADPIADPIADLSGPAPYAEVQTLFDEDYPSGDRYYWSSCHLPAFPGDLAERLAAQVRTAPSPRTTIDVWRLGGAIAREPEGGSAYPRRDLPYLVNYEANWSDPADDDANVAWVRAGLAELRAFDARAGYRNFPGPAAYGAAARGADTEGERETGADAPRTSDDARYERLRNRLDPRGLFRSF